MNEKELQHKVKIVINSCNSFDQLNSAINFANLAKLSHISFLTNNNSDISDNELKMVKDLWDNWIENAYVNKCRDLR